MTAQANERRRADVGLLRRRSLAQPSCGARAWCFAALTVSAALCATFLWRPRPVLLWNASASSKIGLYLVTSASQARVGDMVVAWAPARARRLAAMRGYLPFNVPLVKRVGAEAGTRICAVGGGIFINGRMTAHRRLRDPSGRTMPWWSGCRLLRPGELFLLTPGMPSAFDGRYFGVTRGDELVGKARLLWAKPAERSDHA